jgi:hypothetical protein
MSPITMLIATDRTRELARSATPDAPAVARR